MHVLDKKKMHLLVSIFGSVGVAGLVLATVTSATVVGGPTCVLPNHSAINSDGFSCEPGILSPGQSSSSVITTNVTGGSGSVASARLCLDNENTGVRGPCKT